MAKVLKLDDFSSDETEQNPFFSPEKQNAKTTIKKRSENKNTQRQEADNLYEMTEDAFNSLEEQVDFSETTMDNTEYYSQVIEVIKPDTDNMKVSDTDHFQL